MGNRVQLRFARKRSMLADSGLAMYTYVAMVWYPGQRLRRPRARLRAPIAQKQICAVVLKRQAAGISDDAKYAGSRAYNLRSTIVPSLLHNAVK